MVGEADTEMWRNLVGFLTSVVSSSQTVAGRLLISGKENLCGCVSSESVLHLVRVEQTLHIPDICQFFSNVCANKDFIVTRVRMEPLQHCSGVTFKGGQGNFLSVIVSNCAPLTAAYSSSSGMEICSFGATLDLAMTKAMDTWPCWTQSEGHNP